MADQLPILQIIVPLIAAPLAVLLRAPRLALRFSLVVVWATFGMSAALLRRVLLEGTLRYELGGWAAPWGIEYRLDPLGAFVLLVVGWKSLSSTLMVCQSGDAFTTTGA